MPHIQHCLTFIVRPRFFYYFRDVKNIRTNTLLLNLLRKAMTTLNLRFPDFELLPYKSYSYHVVAFVLKELLLNIFDK